MLVKPLHQPSWTVAPQPASSRCNERYAMMHFVKKVIREIIGEPKTPDECLDALVRFGKVQLPEKLTATDRAWLGLWLEELVTHASASARFRDLFPDGASPA